MAKQSIHDCIRTRHLQAPNGENTLYVEDNICYAGLLA